MAMARDARLKVARHCVTHSHGRGAVGSGGRRWRFCLSTTMVAAVWWTHVPSSVANGCWIRVDYDRECGEGPVRLVKKKTRGRARTSIIDRGFWCDAWPHCVLTSPNARRLYAIHRLSPYLLLSLPISSRQITCTLSSLSVFYIVQLSKCVLFKYISSFCDYNRFTVCKYTFTFLFKLWRDVCFENSPFPSADCLSEVAAWRPHHGRSLYHRAILGIPIIRWFCLPLSQTFVFLSLPQCLPFH